MKVVVWGCVYLGIVCLIMSIISRFGTDYVVPLIRVTATSMLEFTGIIFLMAIGLGVAELLNHPRP